MSEFDSKARDWDKDKIHLERTFSIAEKMLEMIPMNPNMNALEYGAGTGLLSFALKDRFQHITMVDTSKEMVQVCFEKIEASHSYNMNALYLDIQKEKLEQQFDIIFNQMVLHHIPDVQGVLIEFYKLLNKDGYLAIADLYTEDGSFHGAGEDVHPGFDVNDLAKQMVNMGFQDIRYQTCYTIKKTIEYGEIMDFPIFLIVGKK